MFFLAEVFVNRTALALAIMLLVCAVSLLAAQSVTLRFEVASVRALPPSIGLPQGFAMNPRRTGTRVTWTTRLYDLTRYAYNLPAWRISGIDADPVYITIAASADPGATPDHIRLMLRQLLIDRFKLVAHTKTERRSGYALVVATNGPKLQTKNADGSLPPMPSYMRSNPPEPFEGFIFPGAEEGWCAITVRVRSARA